MTIAFFSRAVRITIKCHLSTSSFFEVYLAPQLPHYKAYPFHPAPCLLLPKHNNVGILIIHVLVLLSFSSSQAQPQLRFRPWTKCWISLHNSPCCSPWPLLRNDPLEALVEHPSLHSQVLHGAALPFLPPWAALASSPTAGWHGLPSGHRDWPGQGQAGGQCLVLPYSSQCCSVLRPDPTCIYQSDCHFPGLSTTRVF